MKKKEYAGSYRALSSLDKLCYPLGDHGPFIASVYISIRFYFYYSLYIHNAYLFMGLYVYARLFVCLLMIVCSHVHSFARLLVRLLVRLFVFLLVYLFVFEVCLFTIFSVFTQYFLVRFFSLSVCGCEELL